jgi:ATP-dependent Clp protease ATP-binding subunit ClpA
VAIASRRRIARVVGQEEAIEAVSDAVRRSRKQVWDMRKPVGTDFVLREQPVEKWSKTN